MTAPRESPKLLALDLDGTLLREDKSIAEADRSAIAQAQRRGVHVTIVTGRIASGAVPVARELGIETPLVCADGAQLVQPSRGTLIARRSLTRAATQAALMAMTEAGLTPFLMTHEAIHARREAGALAPWVVGWSPVLRFHHPSETGWPELRDVAIVLGLGTREKVDAAREPVEKALPPSATTSLFSMGGDDVWALRVQVRNCNKREGLSALAARLNVRRSGIAYVGDWYNDIPAFIWSGRSFCMGQAPSDVRQFARETLRATSTEGGGVAEALARWLDH